MENNYNANPNQRMIIPHKEATTGKDDIGKTDYYTKINLNALQNAMHTLTPKAFELWIYLSKNKDNYIIWLSKVDFLRWSNVKEGSYHNAFKELEEKHYLVKRSEKVNDVEYDFYQVPQTPKEEYVVIQTHKEFVF